MYTLDKCMEPTLCSGEELLQEGVVITFLLKTFPTSVYKVG